jgi:hypothetical protein
MLFFAFCGVEVWGLNACFHCVIAMKFVSINIVTHEKFEKEWIVLLEVLKYPKSMDL